MASKTTPLSGEITMGSLPYQAKTDSNSTISKPPPEALMYYKDFHQDLINSLLLRIERIEFYLLTSLGTRRMYLWSRELGIHNYKHKKLLLGSNCFIVLKNYIVPENVNWQDINKKSREQKKAIKVHVQSISSLRRVYNQLSMMSRNYTGTLDLNSLYNEYTELCKYFIQTAFIINETLKEKLLLLQQNQLMPTPLYTGQVIINNHLSNEQHPIFSAYCRYCGRSKEDALEHLEKIFECHGQNIWEPLKLDSRTDWYVTRNYSSEHANSQYDKLMDARLSTEIRKAEGIYYKFSLPINSDPTILKCENYNDSSEVILTDNYSFFSSQSNTAKCYFYGGKDVVSAINWNVFEGKTVRFLIANEDQEHLITAALVRRKLTDIATSINYCKCEESKGLIAYTLNKTEEDKFNKYVEEFYKDKEVPSKKQKKNKTKDIEFITNTKCEALEHLQYPFPVTAGSISMLYSETGVGKTWFAMSFAYSLALGVPFCKQWHTTATESYNVIYIDGEMGVNGCKIRLKSIEHIYNVKLTDNSSFSCLSLGHELVDLANVSIQNKIDDIILKRIEQSGNKNLFVVIDNILSVTNYTENNWKAIYEWAVDIRDTFNATILFIHHANKDGKQYGSMIKAANLDNVILLQKHEPKDPDKKKPTTEQKLDEDIHYDEKLSNLILSFEKHRWTAPLEITRFSLGLNTEILKPSWNDYREYKQTTKNKELLINLLKQSLSKGEEIDTQYISSITGYHRTTIFKEKKELLSQYSSENKNR